MTPEELQLRDEILQVMFWMHGEQLGAEASAEQLAVFLPEASELPRVLDAMAHDGWIRTGTGNHTWTLTELGSREGGRRFTEEFADAGLGSQGHGACKPGCDCETLGPEHCEVHRHHE